MTMRDVRDGLEAENDDYRQPKTVMIAGGIWWSRRCNADSHGSDGDAADGHDGISSPGFLTQTLSRTSKAAPERCLRRGMHFGRSRSATLLP